MPTSFQRQLNYGISHNDDLGKDFGDAFREKGNRTESRELFENTELKVLKSKRALHRCYFKIYPGAIQQYQWRRVRQSAARDTLV